MQIPIAPYKQKRQQVLLFSILAIALGILSGSALFTGGTAYAKAVQQTGYSLVTSCTGTNQPDANSLLVVILDRSGSLIAGDAPTDPNGYSGSATKALADIWPGKIAVVPFGSDATGNDQAPVLGPYAHSNTGEIKNLKTQIDAHTPLPNSETPLGLAMQNAQQLFQQQGVSNCSKVVLITDGQPTGPNGRENEVRGAYSSWFKQQNIPINVFGLKINKSTPEGRDADNLLQTIARKTGGQYDSVQNAQDLGKEIIGLYASWRGLDFTPVSKDTVNGNYPVIIDARATEATIITFHSNGGKNSPLVTKSGQHIPADKLFTTTDVHYQVDRLLLPILPDTYIVNSINDPTVTVYALIASTLQLKFAQLAPVAYTGQPFTIAAHFLNVSKGATTPVTPTNNALFKANISEIINGKTVATGQVDLTQAAQGSDIFKGYYAIAQTGKPGKEPVQIGTISIKVTATYQDATRSTDEIMIPLAIPQAPPPPPPPPCNRGVLQCLWITHHILITDIGIPVGLILVLLMIFLLWSRQPEPHGYLRSKRNTAIEVPLQKRTLGQKLLHRSTITSNEIQNHPEALGEFNFKAAQFTIKGTRSRQDYLVVAKSSGTPVTVKTKNTVGSTLSRPDRTSQETPKTGNTFPLNDRDIILIDNREEAIYTVAPRSTVKRITNHSRKF